MDSPPNVLSDRSSRPSPTIALTPLSPTMTSSSPALFIAHMPTAATVLLDELHGIQSLSSSSDMATERCLAALTSLARLVEEDDKVRKGLRSRSNGAFAIVTRAAEASNNVAVITVARDIYRRLLQGCSKPSMSALLAKGITRSIINLLLVVNLKEPRGQLFGSLLALLVGLASRDSKFAIQCRLAGLLPILLDCLNAEPAEVSLIDMAASVLYPICSSSPSRVLLGKLNTLQTLARLICPTQLPPLDPAQQPSSIASQIISPSSTTMVTLLGCLARLTSERSIAKGSASHSLTRRLVTVFVSWCSTEETTERAALLNSSLAILSVLRNLAHNSPAYLVECNAFHTLYAAVMALPSQDASSVQLLTALSSLLQRNTTSSLPSPIPTGPSFIWRAPVVSASLHGATSESISVSTSDNTRTSTLFLELLHDTLPASTPYTPAIIRFARPNIAPASPALLTHHHPCHLEPEPLYVRPPSLQRTLAFANIERHLCQDKVLNHKVYDANGAPPSALIPTRDLSAPLQFNAHFDSGNLWQAVRVYEHEYDLVLSPDINTEGHTQWFYFEARGMQSNQCYRFNIVNLLKPGSEFNRGMQPCVWTKARGWHRAGSDIFYYRNSYARQTTTGSTNVTSGSASGTAATHFTATFTLTFDATELAHQDSPVLVAYHYPYEALFLEQRLAHLLAHPQAHARVRRQTLCQSLAGNPVHLLTITAFDDTDSGSPTSSVSRRLICISARVHPGESNSSWMIDGLLEFLITSDDALAESLRRTFVFKIVPMLNVDGVANGNHRTSLSGEDLNRQWLSPSSLMHPPIHHWRALLEAAISHQRPPLLFCDLHGHSRRKNVFIFACDPTRSNSSTASGENVERLFPRILSSIAPAFSLSDCAFTVERSKETTARVVCWRHLGIPCSFTLESSYCGASQGPLNGLHFNVETLRAMGRDFLRALPLFAQEVAARDDGWRRRNGMLVDTVRRSVSLGECAMMDAAVQGDKGDLSDNENEEEGDGEGEQEEDEEPE